MKYRVIVTDDRYGSYDEERSVLEEIGAELEIYNFHGSGSQLSEIEIEAALAGADGILVNLFPMTGERISGLDRCKVISRYGVGWENVDIDAATDRGIQVCRVPDYCTEEAADHSVALLLACIRKTVFRDRRIREGGWNLQTEYPMKRLTGKTLGLIGFGRIGKGVHRRIAGFGVGRVLVYDPHIPQESITESGCEPADFHRIIAEADYITVHATGSSETEHLFNSEAFGRMRKGMILVNTSRGKLIDEEALCDALEAGTISSAGLDVFEEEPLPMESRLRDFDTVVLSDHTAYYSEESLKELKTKAARNIAEVLTGRPPTYPVNRVT